MSENMKQQPFEMLKQLGKKRLLLVFTLFTYAVVQLDLLKSMLIIFKNIYNTSVLAPFDITTILSSKESAVLCAIVKDDEFYMEEWLDFNLALGFETIYVYMNDNFFYYNEKINSVYPTYYNNRVQLIHYPGDGMQLPAYNHCAKQLVEANKKYMNATEHNDSSMTKRTPTWAAFFDTDEYLVIKKNVNLIDFLIKYCPSGAIAVNWVFFGQPNTDNLSIPDGIKVPTKESHEFSVLPITKRNIFRPETPNDHVKPIVKISDFIDSDERFVSCHRPILRDGLYQHDTNFKQFNSHANGDAPSDVAVLHHYHYKSKKEYIQKRLRGQSTFSLNHSSTVDLINDAISGRYYGINFSVYDDSAWNFLKEKVPKYAVYDSWFD